MTMVGPALWDATAEVAATAATAATTPRSAHVRLRLCINSPFMLGDTRHGAGWGQAPRESVGTCRANLQWAGTTSSRVVGPTDTVSPAYRYALRPGAALRSYGARDAFHRAEDRHPGAEVAGDPRAAPDERRRAAQHHLPRRRRGGP